jgi:hypothetical protein
MFIYNIVGLTYFNVLKRLDDENVSSFLPEPFCDSFILFSYKINLCSARNETDQI